MYGIDDDIVRFKRDNLALDTMRQFPRQRVFLADVHFARAAISSIIFAITLRE